MIYIENFEGNSFEELLDKCFQETYAFPRTFKDKSYDIIQCYRGANRSFSDILKLCQTYFPETTEANVAKYLIDNKISNLFCDGIEKVVFCNSGESYCETYYKEMKGRDGWSFQKIKQLTL